MYPDLTPPVDLPPLMGADEVKTLFGVTVDTYDAQFDFAVEVVSGLIRDDLGRNLTQGEYEDTFHGGTYIIKEGGGAFLSLSEFPVQSITELSKNGSVDPTPSRLHKAIGITWPDTLATDDVVVVKYEAGYATLPAVLKSVFLDLVKRQLAALGIDLSTIGTTPSGGVVKAVSVGALRVDYAISAAGADVSSSTLSPLSAVVMEQYADILFSWKHPRLLTSVPA